MSDILKAVIAGAIINGLFLLGAAWLVGGNQSGSFGADGDTNLTNLVLEGDLTVGDDTTFTDAVAVSGALTVSGAVTHSATTTQGNYSCKVFSGSFADATTTLFAQINPFGATSTVDMAILDVTGAATTSATFKVGTSTTATPYLASAVSAGIISAPVATSAVTYLTNAAHNNESGGLAGHASMEVGPTQYIVGHASSTNDLTDHNGGILGANNASAGSYKFRVCR